jgi:hypothetical protein
MVGYVGPPEPVKLYLEQTGGWKLRDANWEPHLPLAAEQLDWFFQQGKHVPADGFIMTNLSVVQNILRAVGTIYLPDYDRTLSADDLYTFIQTETEQNFFPGSTKKPDVIGDAFRAFQFKVQELPPQDLAKAGFLALESLDQNDTLVWFRNEEIEKMAHRAGWSGAMAPKTCEGSCYEDYLYIVEANVGSNKSNCCVQRQAEYDVWFEKIENPDEYERASGIPYYQVRTDVKLKYKNNNPKIADPPRSYGSLYRNFLRIYRPPTKKVATMTISPNVQIGPSTAQTDTFPLFPGDNRFVTYLGIDGIPLEIPGQSDAEVSLQYTESIPALPQKYLLTIQRQPGIRTNAYVVRIHADPTKTPVISSVSAQLKTLEPTSTNGFMELSLELDKTTSFLIEFR